MPSWIALGRRKYDYGLMVDFNRQRALVRANTLWIEGIALEPIQPGRSEYGPAMVLIHRDWRNLYFLNERPDWTDDDYFDWAEQLMNRKGIVKP